MSGARSIVTSYNNLRIKHKISIIFSVIMLVFLTFSLVALQISFNIYDEKIYEESSNVLNLSSKNVENELKEIEQFSFIILANSQIQDILTKLKADVPAYDRFQQQEIIRDVLNQFAYSERYIRSIQIIDINGSEYARGSVPITTPVEKRSLIYEKTLEGEGQLRWIMPDEYDDSLIAAREIRAYNHLSLESLGTLVIRINLDMLVNDLAFDQYHEDVDLIISSGKQIIHPEEHALFDSIAADADDPMKRTDYDIIELKGQSYFISKITSDYTQWSYRQIIPFESIFRSINIMKSIVLYVFMALFLAVILLGLRFARSITNPIEDLIARMKHAQLGSFKKAEVEALEPSSLSADEVGQLYRSFRMMIQHIHELITENYTKQIIIKETEFKALQAQINPHFLYNTLESINWIAKTNGQPEISKMVEALGRLLRYSVSLKEHMIQIREELEIVHSYIIIQNFRFEERLTFSLDIPDQIIHCQIPKLTLQPLVENAIHYALEPKVEPCHISVKGVITDECVTLIVEDDGPGMDEAFLAKLRQGLIQTKGKGIGLNNIDERVKLAFGESYGLHIESDPAWGTRVSVSFPHQTGGIQHV
jgi:two-component system, sensor histidine kinase YesM